MNARILIVEDDEDLRQAVNATAEIGGYDSACAANGAEALRLLGEEKFDAVISDVQMEPIDGHTLLKEIRKTDQSLPVILMTAFGSISSAVEAMRDGASDYLAKPFDAEVLISQLDNWISKSPSLDNDDVVFEDPVSIKLLSLIKKVAASDSAVMVTGESGVGKEVVFKLIHQSSPRAEQTPIAINCAAIPDNMLEAMLFGYEKGAFTGAHKSSAGKFEQANGSTLLLDEVSEMSLPLQAKLLRVIQEQQVERLGSNQLIDLDVRIVATSNRNLKEEVAAGNFREDLYFRLNVFPIAVQPLRARPKDILPLARQAVVRVFGGHSKGMPQFSPAAEHALQNYAWPGNARELDNVIQRAVILCDGVEIDEQHLVFENEPTTELDSSAPVSAQDADSLGEGLRDHERRIILRTLIDCHGSRKEASKQLNISPRTLRYKIAEMREDGIEVPGR